MTTALSYTLDAAAEATSLSASTLRRAIAKGLLKARTTELDAATGKPVRGARVVILADDLRAYLDQLDEV